MNTDYFFRELDYPFLDIGALEDVFINLALNKCLVLLLLPLLLVLLLLLQLNSQLCKNNVELAYKDGHRSGFYILPMYVCMF